MKIGRPLPIRSVAGCFALVIGGIAGAAEATGPLTFQTLKPGAVEPTGWLRDWAVDARNGITGHFDERSPTLELGGDSTREAGWRFACGELPTHETHHAY